MDSAGPDSNDDAFTFFKEPAPQRFFPGDLLEDKYRIISEIAHGGMGTVYRAEQIHLSREVAIKVLRFKNQTDAEDKEFLGRFRAEAAILARIRHPNAVSVYDFGFVAGFPYLVMELIEGDSLRKTIRDGNRLSLELILRIGEQVCSAIHHAHSQGVIHRDLKPDNILLSTLADGSEHATVLDFGIAKIISGENSAETPLTETGVLVGTPQYMSPEQIRSQPLDARSDIYALGLILYELLSGKLPFSSDSAVGLAMKHLSESPPPLATQNLHVPIPEELESLILSCLEKKAEKRPRSADQLGKQLADLRKEIFDAGAPAFSKPRKYPLRTSRRAAMLCFPLMMALAWPRSPVPPPPVAPITKTPIDPVAKQLSDSEVELMTAKAKELRADGSYLDAIEMFGEVYQARPNAMDIARAISDCYVSIGDFAEARTTLQTALERVPNDARTYVQLGYVEGELGYHQAAIRAYQKAVQLGITEEIVYNNLGVEYQLIGKYSEAVPAFEKAIRKNPDYLRAFYNLAESHEKIGNWDKAVISYQLAIKLDPKNAGAYQRLSNALSQAGRPAEARREMLNAMRLYPGFDDFESLARKVHPLV